MSGSSVVSGNRLSDSSRAGLFISPGLGEGAGGFGRGEASEPASSGESPSMVATDGRGTFTVRGNPNESAAASIAHFLNVLLATHDVPDGDLPIDAVDDEEGDAR